MENSMTIAVQNASGNYQDTGSSCVKCKFCGKEGLLILPLRCGTAPLPAKAPSLPGNVASHAKSIPVSYSSYTLRMARVGYLYMLVDRKGTLSWQSYIATPEGYWAKFAPDTPPLAPSPFMCHPDSCGINSSMVAIPQAEDVDSAYLLFTPSPLTTAMLDPAQLKSLKKAEELCSKGQMVKIGPAAWVKGSHDQPECLSAAGVATAVSEFVIYNSPHPFKNPLTSALLNATFPLMSTGESSDSKDVCFSAITQHLLRLGPLHTYMLEKKAMAVVVPDPIGITHELNDFRNDALNRVDDYLDTQDAEKVTNRCKLNSLQAVRGMKAGYEKCMVRDANNAELMNEYQILGKYEPEFPDDPDDLVKYKNYPGHVMPLFPKGRAVWAKQHPQEVATRNAELTTYRAGRTARIDKAKQSATSYWVQKYDAMLESSAIKVFNDAFDNASLAATQEASKRVADHLAWVLSDQLLQAFDFFDRKNYAAGFHFEAQSALCTIGMTGLQKSAAQVDAWLNAPLTDRKNIYMRGLLLNQDDIVKEADTALANAAKVVESEPEHSAIGAKVYKSVKGLIDVFRKADSAWDEYVREGTKDGNVRSRGLELTREGKTLFKYSELNRAFFRKGITGAEKKMVGYFGGLVFARMGGLAEKLGFDQLMYGIDPELPHIDPNTKKPYAPGEGPSVNKPKPGVDPGDARDAGKDARDRIVNQGPTNNAAGEEVLDARGKMFKDSQARNAERVARIRRTADEYLKDKGASTTSNYHQVRIGGLLAVMELFSLGGKAKNIWDHQGGTSLEYWEAGANILSVASITCDIVYGLAKSTREALAKEEKVARAAGDITRGGFKMWAGTFSTIAGGISLCLDYTKLMDEVDGKARTGKEALLLARVVLDAWNTGFGAAAAFSYSGPMYRRIIVTMAENAIRRRAVLETMAVSAEWLAARVFLLHLVAWGTGAQSTELKPHPLYATEG